MGVMLPPMFRIALRIRGLRSERGLSQRQIARLVGCSQPYVAQIETGKRPVSARFAALLELALGAKHGRFTWAAPRRGRPPMTKETRVALRCIRRAQGPAVRPVRLHDLPRYPRRDLNHNLRDPFSGLERRFGPDAGAELKELERLRAYHPTFWRHINSVRHDSWPEKRVQILIGLEGAPTTAVRPGSIGCVLPSVDGVTGVPNPGKPFPAFVMQRGPTSLAIFPQRCVATAKGYRWPDNLVVAARGGQRVTGIFEIDGAAYHQDKEKEARRDRDLAVPVLHIEADQLEEEGVVRRILDWVDTLFQS